MFDQSVCVHHGLKKRVARQTVGAMETRARHFTDRIEPFDARLSVLVDDHSATGVVSRRNDRNELLRDVDSEFEAGFVDIREFLDEFFRCDLRRIETDVAIARTLHLDIDRACHDIARCERAERMVLRHELLARDRAKNRALATKRLGDEKILGRRMIEAGRMELHEFQVRHTHARAVRDRDPVARRGIGIRSIDIDLAGATGRQHRQISAHGQDLTFFDVENISAETSARAAPTLKSLGFGDQINRDVVRQNADPRARLNLLKQCFLDREAGQVIRMKNPALSMAAFAVQVEMLRINFRESDSELDELAHARRTLAHAEVDRVFMAKSCTGSERIFLMLLEAVVIGPDRGDSALSVTGRALGRLVLADEQDAGAPRGELQCRAQARDAGSENQNLRFSLRFHHSAPASNGDGPPSSNIAFDCFLAPVKSNQMQYLTSHWATKIPSPNSHGRCKLGVTPCDATSFRILSSLSEVSPKWTLPPFVRTTRFSVSSLRAKP